MEITNVSELAAILAYCKDNHMPCNVIRTPPESKIGGYSCELLMILGDIAVVRIANGDTYEHPMSEIHARGL